jgi:hypothetical protein
MKVLRLYEIRPRKDKRSVNLSSMRCRSVGCGNVQVTDAIGYAKFRSRSHDVVMRVYDAAGNVIERHEHARFQRMVGSL